MSGVTRATSRKTRTAAASADTFPEPKPLLRGWLHLGAAPLALIAGMVLVTFGPTLTGRIGAAVFTITAVSLFGTSAIYHRGTWNEPMRRFLRRLDHANIFLIIAGTYTPLALLLLEGRTMVTALSIVWGGALAGLAMRVAWLHAPRWLYVPLYVGLGWVALGYIGPIYAAGGPVVVTLVLCGGLAYTVGAVVYGLKRPRGSLRYFGFHEIFHALTVAGFVCHYIAASWAIYHA